MSYAEAMRARSLLCLALALLTLALAPTGALASSGNASATQAYVQANYTLVHVAFTHLAVSEAGPLHVLAQVRSECPNAGAGSPQDPESTQMSDEVIGAMVVSAAKPDLSAISSFVRAVSGLRWSSATLTHQIETYVADVKTVLSLPAPDLCGDVRAWAAGGYKKLPASSVAFVGKFFPHWVALGDLPAGLARYEDASTRALAKRTEPLEQELTEGEARAVSHWGEIMNALELWP